jgi:DNA helicase HerA-like ATPase
MRRIHVDRARASDAEKQLTLNTRLTQDEIQRLRDFASRSIPPSWVLIDEAQNILPADRQVKSSDAVLRFVREGRNFGLSFALTTQQPSAVDQKILAQADTVICHRLTVAPDIARMRDNLKAAEPSDVRLGGQSFDLASWLRSLEPGVAVVTNAEYERAFALQVRPRTTPHGGSGFRAL